MCGALIAKCESMQPYQGAEGTSGIEAYETGDDYIRVRFHDGTVYVYTHERTSARGRRRWSA